MAKNPFLSLKKGQRTCLRKLCNGLEEQAVKDAEEEAKAVVTARQAKKELEAVKGGEKVYRLAGVKVYHPLSEKGPRGALSVDLISRFFTLGKALDFVRYPQEMVFEPDEASFCFG